MIAWQPASGPGSAGQVRVAAAVLGRLHAPRRLEPGPRTLPDRERDLLSGFGDGLPTCAGCQPAEPLLHDGAGALFSSAPLAHRFSRHAPVASAGLTVFGPSVRPREGRVGQKLADPISFPNSRNGRRSRPTGTSSGTRRCLSLPSRADGGDGLRLGYLAAVERP